MTIFIGSRKEAAEGWRRSTEVETHVKASTVVPAPVGTLALFMIVSLSASARQSRSVKLPQPVSFAGTEVAPGVYELEWRGLRPDVRITLRAGKRIVAAATGKWADRYVKCTGDALICQTGEGRVGRVIEMQLAGNSRVLVLDGTRSEAQLTSMVIPLCAVSARGNGAAFTPGGGCQHIQFVGKPSANRAAFPADSYFDEGFPQPSHPVGPQRK